MLDRLPRCALLPSLEHRAEHHSLVIAFPDGQFCAEAHMHSDVEPVFFGGCLEEEIEALQTSTAHRILCSPNWIAVSDALLMGDCEGRLVMC